MAWQLVGKSTISQEQLDIWANRLEDETGVHLGGIKVPHLRTQVALRMREKAVASVEDYFALVQSEPAEWEQLTARFLVKESHFFRHRSIFDLVQCHARDCWQASDDAKFRVWSLGCSTGEEAYSLAAKLWDCAQAVPERRDYTVQGLDLCADAIETAKSATYEATKLHRVTKPEQLRYFDSVGRRWRVKPAVRQNVSFTQGNVCQRQTLPRGRADVIVCLNLLIYFRPWRRKLLLDTLIKSLKPDGLLIIGPGEAPGWRHGLMATVSVDGAQAYRLTRPPSVAH
jgi:chemotaxis protein methyltransferase CheR/type IV pilus assembly protein PilK